MGKTLATIRWSDEAETIDHDEYGRPVREEYRRLGANGREEGIYVRFESGFGLNVHIGQRIRRYDTRWGPRSEWGDVKDREFVMGIGGWERLCELADEWRARQASDKLATIWRCAEHEQGTNTIDRPPLEHEVCFGSFDDPVGIPCRWVASDIGSNSSQEAFNEEAN